MFIIKAIVCLFFGTIILAAPVFTYSIFGANLDLAGSFTARQYGASLIGILCITWYARYADESHARRAIIFGLFVYDAIGFIVSLFAVLSGALNGLGWSIVALYLFLAIGFGYFWLKKPA